MCQLAPTEVSDSTAVRLVESPYLTETNPDPIPVAGNRIVISCVSGVVRGAKESWVEVQVPMQREKAGMDAEGRASVRS